MKTKKKPKPCDCLDACQEQLLEKGMALDTALRIDFTTGAAFMDGPFLAAHWNDKPKGAKKLPLMFCAYCPFCGKKK